MDMATNLVGVCAKHRCNMITEDDVPVCLACMKEEAKARAVPRVAPVAVDPGHDVAMNWRALANAPVATQDPVGAAQLATAQIQVAPAASTKIGTFEGKVDAAIEMLRSCPMPKDLKQFKVVQRAIQNLENLTKPQEA